MTNEDTSNEVTGAAESKDKDNVPPPDSTSSPPAAAAEDNTMTTTTAPDEDMDDARPEATLVYKVENFTSLKESVLSPPTMVRNLPWKIMIMPRNGNDATARKSMGFFLQCNGESEASSWSCQASAELRILNHKKPADAFVRKIAHLFYAKENDWGFSHFLAWNEVCDPEKGFVKDDAVTFEVKVTADAPHGVCWDSKKHTGYVGLRNQGATCYMNSLLQVLYFTNILRKCVYKMPTEADDSTKSVGLALQRVFYDLQFLDKAVGTKKLTKSFGWETLDSFMQHDVQEFLRVLLDKLEVKMKDTCVAGIIPKLFEGKTLSYIRCKNVDYTSSRAETFYDIQLNIKGQKTIMDSFRDYVKTENLDGENKYDAGSHGLQDAEKGILFKKMPPILHLHLMRFQYDPVTDSSVKFNDRFEFTDTLDLNEFLKDSDAVKDEKEDEEEGEGEVEPMEVDNETAAAADANNKIKVDLGTYVLHAVLVHSGDNHGGHYVVFINPNCDGKWCKFDDDVVSRCTSREAIQNNFGGAADGADDVTTKQSSNAYMLVYVRKSALKEILCGVKEDDIPSELVERLQEEKKVEIVKRKEKTEAHLYMTVKILFEDFFQGHQGNDLYDTDRLGGGGSNNGGGSGVNSGGGGFGQQEVRVRKQDSLREVMGQLSTQLKCPPEMMRMWPMTHRTNQTLRPSLIDMDGEMDKPFVELVETANALTVFLEMMPPHAQALPGNSSLPSFDKDQDVLLFFKYYDPAKEKIYYMGHSYVSIQAKVSSIVPRLVKRANLPEGTQLLLFEEIKPNFIEKMDDLDKALEHVLDELMDGDIVVFQRKFASQQEAEQYRLPTCRDYFRDLFYRVEVNFVDKNVANDPGFILTLSQRTQYDQMVEAVAKHLDMDKTHLQFFKSANYREAPGQALRCTYEGSLGELFMYFKPRHPKKMFYQKLTIPIHELENKKQFKCVWMSSDQKEEKELTLYPNKNGKVEQLLEEAKQHVTMEANGSGQLRLLDIVAHKIHCVNRPETPIDALSATSSAATTASSSKVYRIEEVPLDQVNVNPEDELIVPVAHFHREAYSAFGNPFLIKIKEGESFETVKERIRSHLDVPEKEFEKYRMALVHNSRAHFFEDESVDHVKLSQFYVSSNQVVNPNQQTGTNNSSSYVNLQSRPFIGLQHANKNSKRARYNYMEKPIKIYN